MSSAFQGVVVLYGGPATGKDTVSAVLAGRGLGYEHFTKIKVGSGNAIGYTLASSRQLEELRKDGRIISEVVRYGATYAIDGQHLAQRLAQGATPLVHTADLAEVAKLYGLGAVIVIMECSRETARKRLKRRDFATVEERLQVWDLVADQLADVLPYAHARIDTGEVDSEIVADRVMKASRKSSSL